MPPDLEAAYRVQSIAIAAWGDRASSGPIFADSIAEAAATNDFPMTADGSALFEAEVVIVTKADARADKTDWTAEEAAELISAVHVGIEIAGSPLETINDLDPVASIAGFGNNSGLILGAEVTDWRERGWEGIICRTEIDGVLVREANAAMVPGIAYALGRTARLGFPLRRGDCISTGAITGTPAVKIGQYCVAKFPGIATIECSVTVARAG
jgi:2-keto-4-pentenoate hydratase